MMKRFVGSVDRLVVGIMSTANNPFLQRLIEVRAEAIKLMDHYGLTDRGWHFQFSNTKHTIGECVHDKKLIKASQHFLLKSDPAVNTDTLLHEIAHALVGANHGHDEVWERKAIELGADPYAKCSNAVSTARYNYRIECPSCGAKAYRYRLKRVMHGATCPDCGVEVNIYKLSYK